MTKSEAILHLQNAAMSPLGTLLLVSQIGPAVAAFTRARADRPDLSHLEFRRVGLPDGNLAIIHGPTIEAPKELDL